MDRNWLGFKREDRNWHGFCVRVENDLFLVLRSIDVVSARVVEIDLVFLCWPKIAWYSVSIELDFVFVWVVAIDLI